MKQGIEIAVDTGGTFTDCVYRVDGELRVRKLRSTPDDPSRSMLDAVAAARRDMRGRVSVDVRHGTTVGTNALLERKGGRVAFVTTAGFEDTLFIGRQARPHLYAWSVQRDAALVSAEMCFGVRERVASDGSVIAPVSPQALKQLAASLRAARPDAIAVSLLFAFANPVHEQAVRDTLAGLGVPVSVSHQVLPEFREYERGATVAINAYLAPVMERYLRRLDVAVSGKGATLAVMQSSGGIVSAEVAAREPVRTILSGPAGGVMGALSVARRAGLERILTFDMGGTSTDVALLETGNTPATTSESLVAGMPVAVPMLDIHTVGAGGGSLAHFDAGGMLVVGPESAGADPGPACYGRGERATVTDANLVLGRIAPDHFLGGEMHLDEARARSILETQKGSLESVEAFAEGIVRLANVRMEGALRRISVERGYDPREFALLSFGGAGPLHACELARGLGIPRVVVPRFPGALSALGILESERVRDFSRTVMLALDQNMAAAEKHFRALESAGRAEMRREGAKGSARVLAERRADLRYAGQGYELSVPWSATVLEDFHRLHGIRYGYADRRRPVELVNVRVRLAEPRPSLLEPARHRTQRRGSAQQAVLGSRRIFADGAWQAATLYDRDRLRVGDRLSSPAVVVEYSATTYLPRGARAHLDHDSNLVVEV